MRHACVSGGAGGYGGGIDGAGDIAPDDDLVMAVTLGVLSSASPLEVLAGEVTTLIMGQFPLSVIPAFFVPVLFICHIIALGHERAGAMMVWS